MKKVIYSVETEFGPIRVITETSDSAYEKAGGPANATTKHTLQKKLGESFESGLAIAVTAARTALKSVQEIKPDEISIETGLTIEAGLWGLAKTEASIAITMTWKNTEGKSSLPNAVKQAGQAD